MRRKEKRLLQALGLGPAALLFLPNVGLWALYRERTLETGGAPGDGQVPLIRQKDDYVNDKGSERRDWHDHEQIRQDHDRIGNGEQGKPFQMTDGDRVDQAYRENGFNIYVSDKISLNRSLPDIRHNNCKSKLYSAKLPNTSVIIPFHNRDHLIGWVTRR